LYFPNQPKAFESASRKIDTRLRLKLLDALKGVHLAALLGAHAVRIHDGADVRSVREFIQRLRMGLRESTSSPFLFQVKHMGFKSERIMKGDFARRGVNRPPRSARTAEFSQPHNFRCAHRIASPAMGL
jgi:hypothetical protein